MLHYFASEGSGDGPHVSLPAEEVFSIGGFPITNSLITGIFVTALLLWMMFYVGGKIKRNERNRFVGLIQWVFEGLYGTVEAAMPTKELARKLAPLTITMFFFILLNYWVGILPFVGPITGGEENVPVFRSLLADLNTTFALAIITIVMAQVYAVGQIGFIGNLNRYFRNPLKDAVGAFEGILELIAEFSRLVGLSLRLFGNVFAGEVLLVMIAYLTVYVSPLALPPFYLFELFIGSIQAYIFFMLTTVFISLGLAGHGHTEHVSDHSEIQPALAVSGNEK
jgi:F-type H+-transporting ATPase subunit a